MVNCLVTRSGSGIDQDAYFWFQHLADGIEQPSVGIDLLCVLLLQDENDLDWDQVGRVSRIGLDQLRLRVYRDLSCVLESYSAWCYPDQSAWCQSGSYQD